LVINALQYDARYIQRQIISTLTGRSF
jgi:hypothetical protein